MKDWLSKNCMAFRDRLYHKQCFLCAICSAPIVSQKDLAADSEAGPAHKKCVRPPLPQAEPPAPASAPIPVPAETTTPGMVCAKCGRPCSNDYYQIKDKVQL